MEIYLHRVGHGNLFTEMYKDRDGHRNIYYGNVLRQGLLQNSKIFILFKAPIFQNYRKGLGNDVILENYTNFMKHPTEAIPKLHPRKEKKTGKPYTSIW